MKITGKIIHLLTKKMIMKSKMIKRKLMKKGNKTKRRLRVSMTTTCSLHLVWIVDLPKIFSHNQSLKWDNL